MQLVRAADGTDIAVHDMGGTGPVLLFAHATGFHGRVWTPIAERLADQFHCVAIDFRGHGDTRAPEGHDFDWSWFADDVLGVVDTLVVDEPIFGVGHSKGGAALLMAEQRRPGTFASLYCYEPITFPRRESGTSAADVAANPLAAGALRRREVFASRAEARTNYASKPPFDGLDPAALSAYVDHGFDDLPDGTVRLKCRGANESATYTMSMRHDAYDRLGEIACPVTVARGAEEAPADNADAVAAALPLGRLERHDDLGHFGPLEAPDRIAGCIRAAFEETSDRTPLPPLDDEVDE
ncbi:MAG: alpha/beta hydrolase, partial [Acidimicrobiia bacterium]|nr:alpha/beta hydrolase [Acidimicrobiia bacterium]